MDIRVNVFTLFLSLIISDCHVGRSGGAVVLGRSKKLIRMLAVITREIAELRSKTLIITSSSAPAPSNKTFTFILSSKESSRAAWAGCCFYSICKKYEDASIPLIASCSHAKEPMLVQAKILKGNLRLLDSVLEKAARVLL